MKNWLLRVEHHRFTLLLIGVMSSMVLIVFQTRSNLFWLQGLVNAVLLAGLLGTLRKSPFNRIVCVTLLLMTTVLLEVNYYTGWRSDGLLVLQVALNTVLYLSLAIAVLRVILCDPIITLESVSGSLAVYTLFVLIYGRLYGMIEQLHPGSFHFGTPSATQIGIPPYPDLIYFSMTALTTVGFGDIAPVSSLARALTMTEALIGPLYLTVLVARLVGLQIANAAQKKDEKPPED